MNELVKTTVDLKNESSEIDSAISEIPDFVDNNISRNDDKCSESSNVDIEDEEDINNTSKNYNNQNYVESDEENNMKASFENDYGDEEEEEEGEYATLNRGDEQPNSRSTPNGDPLYANEEDYLNEPGSDGYNGELEEEEEGEFKAETARKFSSDMTPSQLMFLQAK